MDDDPEDAETPEDRETAYHLFLDREQVAVTASALHLLISDEAHEQQIRQLASEVLERLEVAPDGERPLTVPLTAPQMKIAHTAVRLLLDDLQREQDDERQVLWQVLEKLPDEHAIRAIELD
ncbi:MAG TPA: hypothetical protein VEJ23_04695 [Solirubrobacteraceae bacterium]|nr:hypothetical protein [Solirubrobacteraceae bacterium]